MEPSEGHATTSPFDDERRSIWLEMLQVLLGATGIFAFAFFAVGWLYWLGYFGYFEVPLGAVDLSVLDVTVGAFPRFMPVIAILALFPIMILWERSIRRRQLRAMAEGGALLDLTTDLEKRVNEAEAAIGELAKEAEAATSDSTEDLDRRLKDAWARQEKELKEFEALNAMVSEVNSLIPMRWVPHFMLNALAWWATIALVVGVIVGIAFLRVYLQDGLKSASVSPISIGLAIILTLAAVALASHVWDRRFTAATVLLALTLIVGIPVSAWVDGRTAAYGAWNSNDRTSRFDQVILYSEVQLFDDWETTEGDLFASPELLLIRKAGDTYVVAEDGSSDKVTVISSDTITHVDYFR